MVEFLRRLAAQRWPWALLSGSALFLELCALFFQHILGLHPCVMCIYERIAVLGIVVAGLIGVSNPGSKVVRWCGMLLWGYSAFHGLQLALQHVNYQLHPSPFNVCSPYADFPSWLPLDKWIPWMFMPDGDCSEITWQFLNLSMPQWLVGFFAAYLLVFLVVAVGNLVKGRCCQ